MSAVEGTAICPDCGQLYHVELTDVGVGWVWHGTHCGWGRNPSSKDVTAYGGGPAAPERVSGSGGDW